MMTYTARLCVCFCLLTAPCFAQGVLISDLDKAIRPNGEDQTERIRNALVSDKAKNRKIIFPMGDYKISGPIVSMVRGRKCSLIGEGIGKTRFVLQNDVEEPIFKLEGNEVYKDPYEHLSWITIDEIDFDGGGYKAHWFDLKFAGHVYFQRCSWYNTAGTVFYGKSWWDTTFSECHFSRCGTAEEPVIVMTSGNEPEKPHWCNNIVLDNTRFEQIPGFAVRMDKNCRKNRFISCKFDRVGPQKAGASGGGAFDDRSGDKNIVMGCQFTKTKSYLLNPNSKPFVVGNIYD